MPRSRSSRLEPEDLFELRFPCDPRIAPDGRHVVFVEKRGSLEKNRYFQHLVLLDVETGASHALTSGEQSDAAPTWTPDSSAVVFVSDRGGKGDLWRVSTRGGVPQRMTDLDGAVSCPLVSPDGRAVAFLYAPRSEQQKALDPGRRPQPQVRHVTSLGFKHDGRGFRDGAWTKLWVLDLRSSTSLQVTTGDYDDSEPAWSPDGRHLAFISNRMPRADYFFSNSDLFVVSARGGRLRQLTQRPGPVRAPAWSPDGKRLAFVGHTRFPDPVENMHVWVVPLRGGAPRDLVPDCDLMCDNLLLSDTKDGREHVAPQPVWSADNKRVLFLANWHGETDVWEVPADGGAPLPRTQGRHEITNLTQSRDGRRWAFLCTDPTSPGDVFVAEASEKPQRSGWIVPGAKVTRLTKLNEHFLGRKNVAIPEEFWVTCREGHRVHGWALRAGAGGAGRAPGRGPAILMVHGGPHAMYGWNFFHEMQVLSARGYHVFYANIRGSCGYGNAFMRALVGKWGSPDFRDLVQVADWVETQPYVDKSRIAISGGSYGGYLANWAIANTQRFKCAISMRGISNLVSLYGTSDLGWELVHELDSPVWENVDRYWRISPLSLVGSIRTPLLLMHPEDDLRCPVSQSEELFTALQVLRRDVEMVRFLGESHGLSRSGRPHNRVERLRRICDWFERKL